MLRFLKNIAYSALSRRARFSRIYQNNTWKCDESVSGSGSTLDATKTLRNELPSLMNEYGVNSILDAPCGDICWMENIIENLDENITYTGLDIVDDLINTNTDKIQKNNVSFYVSDIVEDKLPEVDLIMCKDCFIHLCYEDIKKAVDNFKASRSNYLLTDTNCDVKKYNEIRTGRWRSINLEIFPFNFPAPLHRIISDEHPNKYMALWKLSDIPELPKSYLTKT